jgi:predicted alpha-1,2-mannosidase
MKKIILYFFCFPILLASAQKQTTNLASMVNPFIGTGGHGHTFPGASSPFGMVQLSPDTRLDGWDGCGGYHYDDSIIYGFSHTHLSGTGVSDYGDILLMPSTNAAVELSNYAYAQKFSHQAESAHAGFYEVQLANQVKVALTATSRAGYHRYQFPNQSSVNLVLNLKHRDQVIASSLKQINAYEIEGMRRSKAWANDQHVYFVMRFSKPIQSIQLANQQIVKIGETIQSNDIISLINFQQDQNSTLDVKVGISAVSEAGARLNLATEIANQSFEKVLAKVNANWNRELGKITIKDSRVKLKKIFYTALYHAMLSPNVYNDVDGQYRGRDLQIHQSKEFNNYSVFSLWDTYRAAHPLLTMIDQKRSNDFIQTFIQQAEQGGLLPVWELAGNETNCMIGYHSVSVIADAFLKGIRQYDVEKAFEAMKKSANQNELSLTAYRKYGFVPADIASESVSKTLEYAYDDWCIAQMAKALGHQADYDIFIQRAQYYKNVFDQERGFMRARINNSWISPFNPYEVNFNYTEANAWQYLFMVPQDINGLMDLMGGKEKFATKLMDLFMADSATTGRVQADITGLIGQYAHGNEPSHHMAYLFNAAGQPWKTQSLVSVISEEMYRNNPAGLIGNEDCGQMSAWYVWSAMGLYPVTPGSANYEIGSPMFEEVTIHLENGKQFIIKAKKNGDYAQYIQSATFNQREFNQSHISHQSIMNGGTLVFQMADTANKKWAVENYHLTSIKDQLITAVPYIKQATRTFYDSTLVAMQCVSSNASIYYTLNGDEPSVKSNLYSKPFYIHQTTPIKMLAIAPKALPSKTVASLHTKMIDHRTVQLQFPYAPQYAASGPQTLVDFITGTTSFQTGAWQGFEGVDLIATVDLGEIKNIKQIATTFLQDQGSWIFLPKEVSYAISTDGQHFTAFDAINYDAAKEDASKLIHAFVRSFNATKVRYVKMTAKTIGQCPSWHLGAGGTSWIFADEIAIE